MPSTLELKWSGNRTERITGAEVNENKDREPRLSRFITDSHPSEKRMRIRFCTSLSLLLHHIIYLLAWRRLYPLSPLAHLLIADADLAIYPDADLRRKMEWGRKTLRRRRRRRDLPVAVVAEDVWCRWWGWCWYYFWYLDGLLVGIVIEGMCNLCVSLRLTWMSMLKCRKRRR
jgi:hypothetical protein